MKSILVQVDDATARLLDRVAPAAKRQRAQFIRRVLLKALMEAEEQRTRSAYLRQPDAESEADDWSSAGEYRA